MTIAELVSSKNISNTGKIQQSLQHEEKILSWKDESHIHVAFSDNSYICVSRFNN